MAMLMLYGSRINGLCGDHTLKTAVFRFSWGKIILHLFMVCLFWVYFYTIMPRQEHEGKGLFVTSFKNPNSSYIQPQVNNWFKTDKVKKGEGGIQVPGKKPDSAGKSGPKTPAKSKQGMRSSGGGGASPPGKDLVFLVKSPVKLYWLGQLYDYYDGDTWFATDRMAKQKKLRKANQGSKLIQINFTMEKWLSPILYSAYRAEACSLGYFSNHNLDSNFYQFKLPNPDKLPGLPFSYSISTEVECSEIIRRRDRKWLEFVDIKNYLELPGKKISARLAELAKSLVKDEKTAIGKATALRNYLRDNFKYEQFSQHPPEGVEAVDYFLFTLKEGHCEYFASSLAVLARLAGLPSRICTGFSPGNYNALSKLFEVHEYHAHAWTQIYVEEYGWLTFDATPPGYVVSRTLPLGLGSLHDPFGNEWKVRPPELAVRVQELATPEWISGKSDEEEMLIDKILYDVVMLPETIGALMDKAMNKLTGGKNEFSFKKMFENIRKSIAAAFKSFRNRLLNARDWFMENIILGCATAIAAGILISMIPPLIAFLIKLYEKRRCRLWFREAVASRVLDPGDSIVKSYMYVRKTLEINGMARKDNMDLLDYALSLKERGGDIWIDALSLFFLYNQLEYGNVTPTAAKARAALRRAGKLGKALTAGSKRGCKNRLQLKA